MKRVLVLSFAVVSCGTFAFGLPSALDAGMSKSSANAENINTALKVIQNSGVKCDKVTSFIPSVDLKSYSVECDSKTTYTLVKTDDNGMVLETK